MKLLFASCFILVSLFACKVNVNTKKTTTENELLIKQYFEVFNTHNWNKLAAFYTDTASFKDPTLAKGIVKQTRTEIEAKYKELEKIIPDVNDSIISMYSSGDDNVIVEFVSKGTAPDKSKMELPICTIFTINNKLISKDFTYFDNF